MSVRLEKSAVDWLILLYAALAFAGGWTYASLRIETDRELTLEAERNRLRTVVATLQTSTQAMLNDGLGAAEGAVNSVMSEAGDLDRSTEEQRSASLGKMLTGGEYVRSLFIYGPGRYARTSRSGTHETGDAAPEWLALPRSSLNGATWVGKPLADPEAPEQLVIPVARRIITPDRDGVWAGALFAFAGFDDVYRRFGSDLAVMGIIHSDGTVLAAVPADATPHLQPGVSVADNVLFRRASRQPESGVVEGFAPAMGTEMLYGYERVHGYDMSILAGQSRAQVLAPWADRRRNTLLGTLGASALIVLLTWSLNRYVATRHHMRERDRARTERSERQSRALLAFANRHSVGWGGVQSALREICEQSCGVIRADRASVWMLVNEEVLRCVEQFDCSNHRHESGMQVHAASVPEYLAALRDERVIDAEDARTDPRTRELASALSMSAAISLIAAPVRRSGKLAGFVTFECTGATRKWQGDEVTFAAGVADQVAQAYSDCEREEALTDLRQTAAELMRLQDEERRRIGRDLHDSTGQTLAALELSLSRLMQTSGSSSERRGLLEQCAQLASQCSAEIRTASYLLHPPLLDELGLLSALRWLVDGFHERSGIQVRLDLPSSMDRLSRDEELTLFRVAQEALTNVHRHADSALAALRLFHRGDSVILEVEDAGVGTRGGVGSFVLGVGLAGMRERLRQVGGSLTVESSGKGTIVRAALPTRRETTREVVNA